MWIEKIKDVIYQFEIAFLWHGLKLRNVQGCVKLIRKYRKIAGDLTGLCTECWEISLATDPYSDWNLPKKKDSREVDLKKGNRMLCRFYIQNEAADLLAEEYWNEEKRRSLGWIPFHRHEIIVWDLEHKHGLLLYGTKWRIHKHRCYEMTCLLNRRIENKKGQ